ncbi:MAG: D-alanyl-D-alanine carboxypeptidase [Candidatus Spechtbacteria bacterium]|nr:D-alanyl-D-alanine carboxypeptidase [Candidatus Spechtbacteria bacterium]
MDTRHILISVGFAIFLPVFALAGIFAGNVQNPPSHEATARQGQPPAISSFEASVNEAVSDTPTQPAESPEIQQGQGLKEAQSASQDETIKEDNADDTPTETQPTSVDKEPSPQTPLIQDWKDFLSKYNSAPANLPVSSVMMSSNSLFLHGVRSPDLFPIRNWQVPLMDIDGLSVLAVELPDNKILYEKDSLTARPIASISKLMNALVVVDSMALDEKVVISQNAINTTGTEGDLVVNEIFSVNQLLYALLLESSNDAAVALQEQYDRNNSGEGITFLGTMNQKAHELGLASAFFEDSSGLSQNNVASASDVATLIFEAYKNETLRGILALPIYETKSKDGISHRWVSTNSLLGAISGVVAGKTGYTDEAGECMTIVTKITNDKSVVTVVLGSTNRIQAMTNLITWVKDAYYWQ